MAYSQQLALACSHTAEIRKRSLPACSTAAVYASRVRPNFGVYTGQIYRGHVCTPVHTRTRILYASVHPNPISRSVVQEIPARNDDVVVSAASPPLVHVRTILMNQRTHRLHAAAV